MLELLSYSRFEADKTALIMGGSGDRLTFAELDARANQTARALRDIGLRRGDVLAVCIENSLEFIVVACAGRRSGLVIVPISTKLTAAELAFIVSDSGAKTLVVSEGIEANFQTLPTACGDVKIVVAGCSGDWSAFCAKQSAVAIEDASVGTEMLYSSGTTGRPKGIHYHNAEGGLLERMSVVLARMGVGATSVYLSPAPLYHSAPFSWALSVLGFGGTVVIMEKFDAEEALRLIQKHRIEVSQWVPTHFVRLLKLPKAVRDAYDIRSLKLAVHAAAPCPPPVKFAMIDWWGPILLEYFGCTEQATITMIDSADWLAHPGSVGRCVNGKIHILDDEGVELPIGETGLIYHEGGMVFSYHNDEAKTKASRSPAGWTTVGDVGRLDAEGYLYLADRKDFMIISGGVNVYPQEIENLLVTHPRVADAVVLGAPDEDLGEVVTAVVQLLDPSEASAALAEEMQTWLRQSLSGVKAPKRILFRAELPRLPTGKMAKHVLRKELAQLFAGKDAT